MSQTPELRGSVYGGKEVPGLPPGWGASFNSQPDLAGTRRIQVLVAERSWRFKSSPSHEDFEGLWLVGPSRSPQVGESELSWPGGDGGAWCLGGQDAHAVLHGHALAGGGGRPQMLQWAARLDGQKIST